MAGARWLALAGALCFLLLAERVQAADDPSLEYWTIETKHFHIHYEKGLDKLATRLARVAEDIHARLIGPLGYAPNERTELLLTDVTDAANGSAASTPVNTIRLFVSAPGDLSALGDYDDWQVGLLTHEYTHILHTDNISGIPTIINAVLGKTLVPNQIQPRWFLEGLATVFESAYTSGGRIRSSLFDMLLRADYLDDNLARLDQISSVPRRYPRGTLYYLYGSRFLRFIGDIYGDDVFRAVSADYGAGLIPFGINRAIKRQTGRTYVELYEGFKADLAHRYDKQMRGVKKRGLREGERLTYHGDDVSYPVFIPKNALREGSAYQLLYYRADEHNRTGHYWIDLGEKRDDGDLFSEELIARATNESPAGFTPEGDLMFSSVVPYKTVYARPDLFVLPRGEAAPLGMERHRRRLTEGLRASAPAISADGRRVVFTRNHRGTTSLMTAYRKDDGGLTKVRRLLRTKMFDQIFTPVFSPDGTMVAFSHWKAGGYRDIEVLDLTTRKVRALTHDRALDTNPAWSPDGSRVYFASDRGGIFNIHEYRMDDGRLRQVTNVRTGALMPAISPDGKLLVYVGYTSAGYDLYSMELDESRFLMPLAPPHRPEPYAEAPPVPMKKMPYNPLATLRPFSWSFGFGQGNFGSNAFTITTTTADVVGHHSWAASITADPDAPGPQLTLDYGYHGLPFDLSLSLSNRFAPRTDYRISDQAPQYIEDSFSVSSGISYSHAGEFVRQGFAMGYTASVLNSDLPVASVPLDPYAAPTRQPLDGFLSRLGVAYSFDSVEGSYYTLGDARGFSLRVSLDYADELIGSQETLYLGRYTFTTFVTLPWGYQTLALRSSGGLSEGSFARRGTFFVGGYNFETTTLLDQITSGIFNGALVLRGYDPGVYSGSAFILNSAEYRIPLADVDRGIQTVPIYLRQLGMNLFLDYGGAFDDFDFDAVEFFTNGAIIDSPDLHTGIGAELWINATFFYGVTTLFRVGYAFGTSAGAIQGGQPYFIAAGSF